jgi:signal transduction histidine kinase
MEKRRSRLRGKPHGHIESRGSFDALSHQMLLQANRGIHRAFFQEEISRRIIEASGCEEVELWIKEHGKYFRCKVSRSPDGIDRVDVLPSVQEENGNIVPAPEDDPRMSLLIHHIIGRQAVDAARPPFTRNGSFWTGNAHHAISSLLRTSLRPRSEDHTPELSHRSLLLLPLQIEGENIGILQLKSKKRNFFSGDDVNACEGLARNLAIAVALRRSQVDLRERVKELECLYDIAGLAAQPGISIEEILQGIIARLPSAWLYPEIATSRIMLDDGQFMSSSFQKGLCGLTSNILVDAKCRGRIEVVYCQERPELDEGPFLKEERHLLDTVAHEVAAIVRRKEAESQQTNLQAQLQHADRLAKIGQLAAGMAHELNEPLGNILGFAQLVKKEKNLSKQTEQDIDKILLASLGAREIIRKILLFARQTPPKKVKIQLNREVDEGLSFLKARCRQAGVELLCVLSPHLPEIFADPVQMNQVLVNLVINALQSMPQGGQLIIRTLPGKDHVSLVVQDTGTGMSEEVMKQIFTPFFTTKEVGEGTGLGLPVVHGIILSHGASITVSSKVGFGTKFEIKLPLPDTLEQGPLLPGKRQDTPSTVNGTEAAS